MRSGRGSLVIEERGQGPRRALAIHGLGASRDHLYAVADLLAADFTLWLPDLRGHGDSPPGADGEPRSYAEDLLPLTAEHGQLSLIGLSLGAVVAVELWRLAPAAVRSIALVDPVLDARELWRWAGDGPHGEPDARRRMLSPFLERELEPLIEVMSDYPLTRGLPSGALRQNAESHLRADQESLLSTTRALGEGDSPWAPERPPGAGARAVLVRALRSPGSPPEASAAVARGLGAEVMALDCGHCASLDSPEPLAELLRQVL